MSRSKKYEKLIIAWQIIHQPREIESMLESYSMAERPSQETLDAGRQIVRRLAVFDRQPIVGSCSEPGCRNGPVTYSVHPAVFNGLYQWCESCDPRQLATGGSETVVFRKYEEIADHRSAVQIIAELAQRKGLKESASAEEIEAFFERWLQPADDKS